MKICVIFATLGVLSLSTVNASADDQNRLELARHFVRSAHVVDSMKHALPLIIQNLKPAMLAQMGGNEKFGNIFIARFLEQADGELDNFADTTAQIYANQFSEQDLKNMIAFYESPTGKVLTAKTPALQSLMSDAGRQWGIMIAGKAMQQYSSELAQAQKQGMTPVLPGPAVESPSPVVPAAPQ